MTEKELPSNICRSSEWRRLAESSSFGNNQKHPWAKAIKMFLAKYAEYGLDELGRRHVGQGVGVSR